MEIFKRNSITNYIKERRKIFLFATVVMTLTMIPYFVGYATQGEEWRFTGFVIGVEDGNSYITKMLSGANGEWLFRTPYSTEYQQGFLAFISYILLGKLSSQPAQHDQLVALYHWFRFFSGILAITAGFDFISLFIKEEKWRWWALTILAFGGGCGWILVILEQKNFLGSLPLEFISPESFGFLGLLGIPHLALARACFLWGLTAYLKEFPGYITGLFWFAMGFLQPIFVVVAWAVVCVHLILISISTWREQKGNRAGIWEVVKGFYTRAMFGVIISFPLILYTAISFFADPFLKTWAKQNRLPSPHLIHYLVAYGLYIPFLIMGVKILLEKYPLKGFLIAGWLAALPILVSAPVSTQRRLAEGVWAAITIAVISYFEKRNRLTIMERGYLYLTFPSAILIFLGSIAAAGNVATPLFRPEPEIRMYKYLAESVPPGAVVLASYELGNNLPAWAPHRVVLGHGPETMNRDLVEEEIERVFSMNSSDTYREKIINKYGVNYILWGPLEKELGNWNPAGAEYLIEINIFQDYIIFQTTVNN
jgi:hypothetical protein